MIGNNPLHLAACTHHIQVVTLLLKGGKQMLLLFGRQCFIYYFMCSGTDVSSCNAEGRSPLHLAQAKLRILTQCNKNVSAAVKQTVLQVIEMLLAYFDKQKNSSDEAELLNAFQTRLQISDNSANISSEIQDLLNNLSTLELSK